MDSGQDPGPWLGDAEELFGMSSVTVSVVSACGVGDREANAEQHPQMCWWPERRGIALLPAGK